MSRARSSRASAVRARSLFKELENEDEDGGKLVAFKPESKKRKRGPADDDEEFDIQKVTDDASDGEGPEENEDDEENVSGASETEAEPEVILDSNEIQRRRNSLCELWSDFICMEKAELREIPPDLRSQWTKKKKGKGKYTCPEKDCRKSFTTVPGIVYHYKRCGLSVITSDSVKCKLCDASAPLAKKLLHHLYNDHLSELPPPPSDLTVGLADRPHTRHKNGTQANGHKTRERRAYASKDNIKVALEYRQSLEHENMFPTRMPLRKQWMPLSSKQSEAFLPQCTRSANLKVKGEQTWRSLNLFESHSDSCHRTFFTGGPVFSAAWVPTPTSCSSPGDQVLSLSIGMNFEDTHAFSDQDAELCLLQFWRFENLENKVSEAKPQFVFGVALTDGIVWDMEWCPLGNSWMPPSTKVEKEHLPRMGLLCLACGNGVVKILSVPHVQFISSNASHKRPLIFTPSPVIILDPPGTGPLSNHEPSICKCISWKKTDGHRHIAAGFGSGVIAVWDIETKCRFLRSKESTDKCDILLPSQSFSASGTSVNAVCWSPSPGSTMLASGSGLDRELFFWDLTDLRCPYTVGGKKGFVTSMEWPFRWNGVFVSQDEGFSGLNAGVLFVNPIKRDRPTFSTCVHKSAANSASYNEWANVEASGDASGEVVAFTDFDEAANPKRRANFRFPIYRMQPVSLQASTQQDDDSKSYRTYDCMTKHFGMEFHDHDLSSLKKIRPDQMARVRDADTMSWLHPTDYPLLAVNRVAWNPNRGSFSWMFSGGQSGVCRISHVSLLKSE